MNDISFRPDSLVPSRELSGEDIAGSRNKESLIKQYAMMLRRQKWWIAGAIALAAAVGLIVTAFMTPQYTATSTIEIARDSAKLPGIEGLESKGGAADMEFYQTQYGLLRSQSLAERVARELRLGDTPKLFEMFGAEEATEWFEGGRLKGGAPSRELRLQKAGAILRENLTISPVRLSRLVTISFTSPDSGFSALVANAWGRNFISATLERRYEATSYARNFLQQRLEQLRRRLDESERALVGYAAKESIINLPASNPTGGQGAATGERSLAAENLGILNQELSAATADRVKAQSRLQGGAGTTEEALTNETINQLRAKRAQLASEYSAMLVQFEPGYPPALAIRRQLDQIDRAIGQEEARVRNSLRETYRASLTREADLSGRVNGLKSDLLDLRRRSIQYNIFQRDVDTNRQLYDALLQRYKEIGVAGGIGVNNVSIVDPAQPPHSPSKPRLLVNLLMSLIAGFVLGLALALLREHMHDSVTDPSEIGEALNLPVLGVVPKTLALSPIAEVEDRKSDISEAYLAVQTNLAFSTDHGVPRLLAVTSSRPAEGKSTSAYALARSLSRTGRKVLLVDGDMRSPSVHQLIGSENKQGLSNYLAGDDDLGRLIIQSDANPMAVMVAGPQPPSAAELLAGDRLALLMTRLQERFDHVIIDAPPVMGLADAPLLGTNVEGVVFVVESNSTKTATARVAVDRLLSAHTKIVGVILTKFEAKRTAYGYGYGYGYGRDEQPA